MATTIASTSALTPPAATKRFVLSSPSLSFSSHRLATTPGTLHLRAARASRATTRRQASASASPIVATITVGDKLPYATLSYLDLLDGEIKTATVSDLTAGKKAILFAVPDVYKRQFPAFPALRHLELTGMLPEDDTATVVATVAWILRRTPSLEALTLFFLPEPEDIEESDYSYVDEEELLDGHKLKYDWHASLAMPDVEIPCCLRETTKEINLVHYEGDLAQRTLAKFLLCNATVVEEAHERFPPSLCRSRRRSPSSLPPSAGAGGAARGEEAVAARERCGQLEARLADKVQAVRHLCGAHEALKGTLREKTEGLEAEKGRLLAALEDTEARQAEREAALQHDGPPRGQRQRALHRARQAPDGVLTDMRGAAGATALAVGLAAVASVDGGLRRPQQPARSRNWTMQQFVL
ncbi:hypothetical protein BAE44_0021843 [Dichanthelium oligosanthes]|uniref:FBD domain-containing protein n=1 Tax=Dichanthelium oligosanthes TaxID=888268 RepID=A0A1E5UWD0_9POAL|nr:hypothetical protein BAE44_0021843 [Dichanthelium oligosanthes]